MRLSKIQHLARAVLVIAGMSGAVGLLTYLVGSISPPPRGTGAPAAATATPAPADTPAARLAQLQPALVAYLNNGQPDYNQSPFQIVSAHLPPIGSFLPRTGNTRFSLPVTPTPPLPPPVYPAAPVLPYPTSPPVPTPVIPTVPPGTPTPDLVATIQAFAASVPYGDFPGSRDNCAPSGNPVSGTLTQYFNWAHSGIDLGVPLNTPVQATHSGIITWAGWNTYGYGNLVIVQNGAFITYYAHLTSANVAVGDMVVKDAIIGWSGSTGNSSGPHVHYETRVDDVPLDPLTFDTRGYGTC